MEAVIGEEQDLLRVTRDYSDIVRFVDQPVIVEPHAFALRRQDANLRNLLNRTIQYLTVEGQLEVLFNEYFPGARIPDGCRLFVEKYRRRASAAAIRR